jgi:hypothetical protein
MDIKKQIRSKIGNPVVSELLIKHLKEKGATMSQTTKEIQLELLKQSFSETNLYQTGFSTNN